MTPSVENALPAPAVADATPPAPAPLPEPEPDAAEAAAWAELLAAWDDELRHRAYLSRFLDLEGLAIAGRRYRAVLAERPGDAVAARFRDEVLRRALAHGLASLPREPDRAGLRIAARVAAAVVLGGLVGVFGYMAFRLLAGWGATP